MSTITAERMIEIRKDNDGWSDGYKDAERWRGDGLIAQRHDLLEHIDAIEAELATLRAAHQPDAGMQALGCHAYASSDKHLSGYRLTLGFDTLEQVQAAHQAVVDLGKRLRAAKES